MANNPVAGANLTLWEDKIGGLQLLDRGAAPVVGTLGPNNQPSAFFSGSELLQAAVTNFRNSDSTGTLAMVYSNTSAVEGYGFTATQGGNLVGTVILTHGSLGRLLRWFWKPERWRPGGKQSD